MGQDLVHKLASGENAHFGYVRLESGTRLGDRVLATFSEHTPATAGLAQYGVSPGYCIAIDCSSGCAMVGSPSHMSPGQLPAGDLSLKGPTGRVDLYTGKTYTISLTGGSGAGPFSVEKHFDSQFTQFTNLSEYK